MLSDTTKQWLANEGFDPANPNCPGKHQDSPLILASRRGELAIATALIAAGVDINHRNMDGTNALWAAVVADSFELAEQLLVAGIDIDNINDNGATTLMYAASAGKTPWVEFLLAKGAATAHESLDGFSALDLASNIECLRLLRRHDQSNQVAGN